MVTERVNTETGEIVLAKPEALNIFGASEPVKVIERAAAIATALSTVLRQQRLTSNIQGKEYVRVEGWTLLGSMLGVFPIIVWTRRTEDGWEARVEARTLSGAMVGAAEASCDRTEDSWVDRDDYALRSMAQTRATSKALRLPLGFVVTMAGFEATPAEEVPRDGFPSGPRGAAYGTCAEHGVVYFKRGQMKTPAHKTADGGWCNKPAEARQAKPSLRDQAITALRKRFDLPADQSAWVEARFPDMKGRPSASYTDADWQDILEALRQAEGPAKGQPRGKEPDVAEVDWDTAAAVPEKAKV